MKYGEDTDVEEAVVAMTEEISELTSILMTVPLENPTSRYNINRLELSDRLSWGISNFGSTWNLATICDEFREFINENFIRNSHEGNVISATKGEDFHNRNVSSRTC